MVKIKLGAIVVFLITAAIVLSNSRQFTATASGDVLAEIAKYKTWQRINKEPIKVGDNSFNLLLKGNENTFIVDGQDAG